jgi:nitroreductase
VELYEAIDARRSVRQFKPDAVSRDVLDRVMSAATLAPSARNEQPWMFHVATGASRQELGRIVSQTTVYLREYVDSLGPEGYDRAVSWYSSLGDAPVLVALSAPESEDDFTATNRVLSVGAALENMLLAIAEEGLGACALTFSYWVKSELAKTLSLPEGRTVVCVVAVGWPASDTPSEHRAERHAGTTVWLD